MEINQKAPDPSALKIALKLGLKKQ